MGKLFLLSTVEGPGNVQVILTGLITVFVVLILLIGIIRILGAIVTGAKGKQAPAAPAPAPAPAPAAPVAAATGTPNKQQFLAAVAAAIAEDMGTDVSGIRIHSVKKL